YESAHPARARRQHFRDPSPPNPLRSPRIHMKVQTERSLQEAGAISLSAGLSRPERGFCKQSEAGHGRQECYTESATIPCADHCRASLVCGGPSARIMCEARVDVPAVAQNVLASPCSGELLAYQRSATAIIEATLLPFDLPSVRRKKLTFASRNATT